MDLHEWKIVVDAETREKLVFNGASILAERDKSC